MKQITITYEEKYKTWSVKNGKQEAFDYIYVNIDGYFLRTPVIGKTLGAEPTLLSDEEPAHGLNDLLTNAIHHYRKMSGEFKGQLELDFGEDSENN